MLPSWTEGLGLSDGQAVAILLEPSITVGVRDQVVGDRRTSDLSTNGVIRNVWLVGQLYIDSDVELIDCVINNYQGTGIQASYVAIAPDGQPRRTIRTERCRFIRGGVYDKNIVSYGHEWYLTDTELSGGIDCFTGGGNYIEGVRVLCHSVYHTGGAGGTHSDCFQSFSGQGEIRLFQSKLIGPYLDDNSCIQGFQRRYSEDCYMLGGSYTLQAGGQDADWHVRAVVVPPSVFWPTRNDPAPPPESVFAGSPTLTDCIEGSWEGVWMRGLGHGTFNPWYAAGLGPYPGVPGRRTP